MEETVQTNQQPQGVTFPATVIAMSKDMNFFGIFCIVYGVLCCLSIIGAAFGIPMIFAGIRLKESSEAYKNYISMNDFRALEFAFVKQQRFFYIVKVLTIISIILYALIIIFYIVLIIFIVSTGSIESFYDSF